MAAEQRIDTRTKVNTSDLSNSSAQKTEPDFANLAAPPVAGGPALSSAFANQNEMPLKAPKAKVETISCNPTKPAPTIADAFAAYIAKLILLAETLLKKIRDGLFGRLRLRPRLAIIARKARSKAQHTSKLEQLRSLRHDDDSDVNKRRKIALNGWGPREKR